MRHESLPVVIIGAGPVGLAAAAHVLSRNLTPLVLEAGRDGRRRDSPLGARPHVLAVEVQRGSGGGRDPGAIRLVDARRRRVPDRPRSRGALPGAAGRHAASWPRTSGCNTRVIGVARQHHDLMKDGGAEDAPFLVRVAGPDGEQDVARAGGDRRLRHDRDARRARRIRPARARRARGAADHIFYGIPDVLGRCGTATPGAACWSWAADIPR